MMDESQVMHEKFAVMWTIAAALVSAAAVWIVIAQGG